MEGMCSPNHPASGTPCQECSNPGACAGCAAGACEDAAECTAAGALETTISTVNGCSGIYFRVESTEDIIVTGLDLNLAATDVDVDIYMRTGDFVGFEDVSGAWRFVEEARGLIGQGVDQRTFVPLKRPQPIAAGAEASFYVNSLSGTLHYNNGTSINTVDADDGVLTLYQGAGSCATFGSSPIFTRRFSGTIHYVSGNVIKTTAVQPPVQPNDGLMFDIEAGPQTIELTHLLMAIEPGIHEVDAYFKIGSHVGYELDSSAWVLLNSAPMLTYTESTGHTTVDWGNPLRIPANETYALYVTAVDGTDTFSAAAVGTGVPATSSPDITLYSGVSVEYPFASFIPDRVPGVWFAYELCD